MRNRNPKPLKHNNLFVMKYLKLYNAQYNCVVYVIDVERCTTLQYIFVVHKLVTSETNFGRSIKTLELKIKNKRIYNIKSTVEVAVEHLKRD